MIIRRKLRPAIVNGCGLFRAEKRIRKTVRSRNGFSIHVSAENPALVPQGAERNADMKEQAAMEAVERGFLNPGQAARFLSISRRYLGHLTGIGVIPVHRLGSRCVRYSIADLNAAMATFRRGK